MRANPDITEFAAFALHSANNTFKTQTAAPQCVMLAALATVSAQHNTPLQHLDVITFRQQLVIYSVCSSRASSAEVCLTQALSQGFVTHVDVGREEFHFRWPRRTENG